MTEEDNAAGRLDPAPAAQSRRSTWGNHCEDELRLTLEAHRRFLAETQDPRLAATLTLAWATLMAGGE